MSCFVTTMKLPHALQIYSTVCEEVYAVAFFKNSASTSYR